MDVLTDLLQSIKLSGDIFFRCTFTGHWGMQIDETPVAEFHLITDGSCWVKIAEKSNLILLQKGDIILFPHGHAHVLLDSPETIPTKAQEIVPQLPENYGPITYGEQGTPISMLCGYFNIDPQSHSALLNALPQFIHIHSDDVSGDFPWLQTTMHFIDYETNHVRPGTQAVVDRLVEILFIQILRTYIATSNNTSGLLGAIADQRLGQSLKAMHKNPAKPWSLDQLASLANMSRSAFAARFKHQIGQTPMQYLTEWRMHKAKSLIETTRESMGGIAEQCGYQSESSFSKAFKKEFHLSPGSIRKVKKQFQKKSTELNT